MSDNDYDNDYCCFDDEDCVLDVADLGYCDDSILCDYHNMLLLMIMMMKIKVILCYHFILRASRSLRDAVSNGKLTKYLFKNCTLEDK